MNSKNRTTKNENENEWLRTKEVMHTIQTLPNYSSLDACTFNQLFQPESDTCSLIDLYADEFLKDTY